ncbi:MAG: sulfite exporter TauE/SafE family protein [Campylobacterota bacterium]|nr:sulfite exporter TauE/SafE family protein [Campylobacterota bacterium]
MDNYLLYFLITTLLSILFAMAGAGAGVALIPIFNMMGLSFNLAKAIGLFAGGFTTLTSTVMNMKRHALDIKFAFPIALMMVIFAPLGAYSSQFFNEEYVKMLYMIMLFYSASMMVFGKKKSLIKAHSTFLILLIGMVIGYLAGLLGVGGGNILIPLLILMGYEAKKVATTVSFVVPFSAFSSFFTYASFVQIDYMLLFLVAGGALLGGYIGNFMMHYRLSQAQIKKLMGMILYLLAFKMLGDFLL